MRIFFSLRRRFQPPPIACTTDAPRYAVRRSAVPALRDVPSAILDEIPADPADARREVQAQIAEITELVAPGERSRKRLYDLLEAMTGIPARRLKDLWGGNVTDPPGSQVRTVGNALRAAEAIWRMRAMARLERIGAKGAERGRIESSGPSRPVVDKGSDGSPS